MALNWSEAKKEAARNEQQKKQEPKRQIDMTEMEELRKEIEDLKELIDELLNSEVKHINDNFNYLVDEISPKLEKAILEEISPMIKSQKAELQTLNEKVDGVQEKVNFFFCISGVKEFLFWTSIVANIGLAAFAIYNIAIKGMIQ